MKITLIGGGGVRTPFFMAATLRRAEQIGLDELCLMDNDVHKLELIGMLCQQMAKTAGYPFRVRLTQDIHTALTDAKHVVMSIRVGCEPARILDERIALKHGVLGQETTGPGGFAMSLRSIPVVLEYAELFDQLSPGGWIYNFTNPAGLVTQALQDAGYLRSIGICDSANGGQHAVAKWLNIDPHRLKASVFGLNHLSWTQGVLLDGKDMLPDLLNDPKFLSQTTLNMFDPELVKQIGMYINEYLFYYYYAEKALSRISAEKNTRGEEILALNQQLIKQLEEIDIQQQPEEALRIFYAHEKRRGSTYMQYAHKETAQTKNEGGINGELLLGQPGANESEDSYAGVALSIIEAFETGKPLHIALNVPNRKAIIGMDDEDIVEISCKVDKTGIEPHIIGEVPQPQLMLMKNIKLYEKLTLQAIQTHSKQLAIQALMVHPLVISYSRARKLVNEYLTAHAAYVGEWS